MRAVGDVDEVGEVTALEEVESVAEVVVAVGDSFHEIRYLLVPEYLTCDFALDVRLTSWLTHRHD